MKIQAPLAAALLAGLLTLPAAAQSDPQTDHTNPAPSDSAQTDAMARQQSDGALAGATFSPKPDGGIGGPISPSATSATTPPATPPAAPTTPPTGTPTSQNNDAAKTADTEAQNMQMGPLANGAPPAPQGTDAQAPADTSDPMASVQSFTQRLAQQSGLFTTDGTQNSYASNNGANGAPAGAGTSPNAFGTAPDAALSSGYTYTRDQGFEAFLEAVDPNFTRADSGLNREESGAVPGRIAFDRQSPGRAPTRDFRPAPLTFSPNRVSAD